MSHFKGPDISQALPGFQPNGSVFKLLVDALKTHGTKTGLVEGHTGKTASFSTILQHSTALATGLQQAGVTDGDPVVLCCNNSIEAYKSLLGVILIGATAVIVPTPYADAIHRLTRGHTVKAVLYDSVYGAAVRKSVSQMTPVPSIVTTTHPDDPVLASLLQIPADNFQAYEANDPNSHVAAVLFSSGTTGNPKGVEITAFNIQWKTAISECGPYLITNPFFWGSTFTVFIMSIHKGFPVILTDNQNPTHNLRLVEKYKVKFWVQIPILLGRYIEEVGLHNFDVSSVKSMLLVGDFVLSSVCSQFFSTVLQKAHDVRLVIIYGSTETSAIAKMIKGVDDIIELGACGNLCPGVELKIVDGESRTVQVGVVGEVCVKTPTMTPGYWGRPELNTVFDKDGFYNTGDTGIFDKNGCLYLRGRASDVITYRNSKFYPSEVEDILSSHPAVVEVAVIGKPNLTDIQHPVAFVVTRPSTAVQEQDIRSFVDGKVGDHMKLRGGVRFMDALPRAENGKIKRGLLRQLVAD